MDTSLVLSPTEAVTRGFIAKVYGWMAAGLALTGWIAGAIGTNPAYLQMVLANRVIFYGLIIGEFALVLGLSAGINRMTAGAATMAFLLYAAFSGVTLSTIFLAYTASSIASAFFITAGTFGVMSVYGYATKRDLTSFGHLCFMALIGLIIATVVNLFLRSEQLMWVTSIFGILVFVGLTAFDTQKIKRLALTEMDEETATKGAILGALALYLDFVNIFLYILRISGRRR